MFNIDGTVDAIAVIKAIKSNTALVTVMHSNNEVGSVMPIRDIAIRCRQLGILTHTDAAQSCGKVKIDVEDLHVDMLTVVGHKFGAPKGVAALYMKDGCFDNPEHRSKPKSFGHGGFLLGGGQESGRRGGTENVLLISALGAACSIVTREQKVTITHMKILRAQLLSNLSKCRVPFIVNGPKSESKRLPNTLSISFKGVESSLLLHNIKSKVAASAGSACHTGGGISSVLKKIHVNEDFVAGTLRLSVGRHTTVEDVDTASKIILDEIHGINPQYLKNFCGPTSN
jgi:cysteine desulfurase